MEKIIRWIKNNLPDEMDRTIRLKSIQWTWLYSIAFLLVWMWYEIYNARQFNARINTIPGLFLSSQILVLTISQLLYRMKLTKGEDEETANNKKNTVTIVAVTAAIVTVSITIITYVIIRFTA